MFVPSVPLGEAKSTLGRRSSLHLFRLGEAMLRVIRNKNRPLLHVMRAWSVVAPHLVEVETSHLFTYSRAPPSGFTGQSFKRLSRQRVTKSGMFPRRPFPSSTMF